MLNSNFFLEHHEFYRQNYIKWKIKNLPTDPRKLLKVYRKQDYSFDWPYQNYVNPVYCFATVCHQVCCMYWGHLGHFDRVISHLMCYKIVCTRYLACTFSQMKSINMFSMVLQSGVPRHFLWRFIAVWICNLTVFMFMHVNVDLKL